jgi:hypothetical protein
LLSGDLAKLLNVKCPDPLRNVVGLNLAWDDYALVLHHHSSRSDNAISPKLLKHCLPELYPRVVGNISFHDAPSLPAANSRKSRIKVKLSISVVAPAPDPLRLL